MTAPEREAADRCPMLWADGRKCEKPAQHHGLHRLTTDLVRIWWDYLRPAKTWLHCAARREAKRDASD